MLRKNLLTCLLSLILSISVSGQITIQIDQVESCSSPVVVPVIIQDDVELISLQFTIVWDQPELSLNGTQNPFTGSGILFGSNPDSLSFSWFNFNGYNFTAGETLFELVFDVTGTLGFTYDVAYCLTGDCITPLEAAAPGFIPVPVTPVDGSVTISSDLPTIICPDNITVNNDAGTCGANVSWSAPAVADCDNNTTQTPVSTPASGSFFPVGTTTVTVTVTDNSGNPASCTFDVIVNDTEAPVLTCPTPTINLTVPTGTTSINVSDAGLVPGQSDNCPNPTLSYVLTGTTTGSGTGDANGQSFNLGTTTVTYTLSDGTNSDQCTVIVNITEQAQDAITVQIVGETLDCGDNFATVQIVVQNDVDLISAQFNVQWPDPMLSYNSVSNVLFPSGVLFGPNPSEPYATGDFLTFTWFSSAGVSLNAGDVLFEINFDVTGSPGDCFDLNFFETPNPPPPPTEFAGPGFVNVPANMVGGQVCIGTTSPVVMTCPTNVVLECGASTDIANTGNATASDDCGTVFTITHTDQTVTACGNTQTITRTFTAMDGATIAATCQQTITVEDNTDPTFDSTPMAIADLTCGQSLPTQEVLTASDNCGAAMVTPSVDPFTVDECAGYSVTYRWVATDLCGNTTETSVTFAVLPDNEDPVFDTTPQPLADITCGQAFPDQEVLTATDNCSTVNVVPTVDPFTADPCAGYTVTYRWTVTDDCNNSAEQTVSFNVLPDNEAPTMNTTPAPLPDITCGQAFPDQEILTATDNCDMITVVPSVDPFTADPCNGYTVTYRWTATDACNNVSMETVSFNVLPDNEAPTMNNTPAPLADITCGQSFPVQETLTATDNCDMITVIPSVDPFTADPCNGYTVTYRWTATDACNNVSMETVSFNVLPDTQAPTMNTTPAPLPDITCGQDFPDQEILTATDNCDMVTVVPSIDPFTADPCNGYTVTYRWTATDMCNNVSMETVSFNVLPDTQAPTMNTTPAALPDITCGQDFPDQEVLTATDNCDIVTVIPTVDPFTADPCNGYTVTYRWTATDACNNSSVETVSFNVLTDNQAPPFDSAPAAIADISCGDALPTQEVLTATDNCDATIQVIASIDPFTVDECAGYAVTYRWTATDACGNSSVETITFNVLADETGPTFDSAPTTLPDLTCLDNLPVQEILSASDDCGTAEVLATIDPFTADACAGYTVTHRWVAIDDCNNETVITESFAVLGDNDATTFNAPANITINCNEDPFDLTITGDASDLADNCDADPTIDFEDQINLGGCSNTGTVIRSWTATDACGNVTTAIEQTITVTDDQAPTFDCQDITINLDSDGNASITAEDLLINITDVCDANPTVTASSTQFSCADIGENEITVTVSDVCGNTATCTATVTVNDNTPPSISCPEDVVVNLTGNASSAVVNNISATDANDECGATIITYATIGATDLSGAGDISGASFNLGVTQVTYTATDMSGNTVNCTFSITVNGAVTIACPDNLSLAAPTGTCEREVSDLNVNILSGSALVQSISYELTGATTGSGLDDPGSVVFNLGMTVITFTVTDVDGNEIVCSFTVEILDEQAPELNCAADQTLTADPGITELIVNGLDPSFSDICSAVDLTYELSGASTGSGIGSASGLTFPLGTSTITYTATDASGNMATCTTDVTILSGGSLDLINCPASVSQNTDPGECGAIINNIAPQLLVSPGEIANISFAISGATTLNGADDASGTFFQIGTSTVTYIAIGTAGQIDNCSFEVTVSDNESPTITCSENLSLTTDAGSCTAMVNNIAPLVTENCTIASITYNISGATSASGNDDASGEVFNLGQSMVTYTVTDDSGNTADCSFMVVVNDEEAPSSLTCPENQSFIVGENVPGLVVNDIGPGTVTDNCGSVSITFLLSGATNASGMNDASGQFFAIGITTVTYIATDENGQSVECSFTVMVNDGSTFMSCPSSPVNQNNDPGLCGAVVNDLSPIINIDPSAYDSVTYEIIGSTFELGNDDASGLFFNVGTSTLTYSMFANNELVDQCQVIIVITDNEMPTMENCPMSITLSADENCEQTYSWTLPTFSDNCGISTLIIPDQNPGDAFPLGTTEVRYAAIDNSGNSRMCIFIVTVVDDTAPTISELANINAISDADACGTNVSWTEPNYSDNCDDFVNITSTHSSGDFFPAGETIVNYEATDFSGNSSSTSFTITVVDDTPPSLINCPPVDLVQTTLDNCQVQATWGDILANDNCGIASFTISHPSGTIFTANTTVTIIAIDVHGNSEQCSFDIEVGDNSPPMWESVPEDVTLELGPNSCEIDYHWVDPIASDDCGNVIYNSTVVNGSSFGLGVHQVTFTATDGAGNIITHILTITVEDNLAPDPLCPAPIVVREDGLVISDPDGIVTLAEGQMECGGLLLELQAPSGTDNCDQMLVTTLISGPDLSQPLLPGNFILNYSISDASGNSTNCAVTLDVVSLPSFTISASPAATGCLGDEIELIPSMLVVGTDIDWNGPNFFTSNELNPTIVLGPNTIGEYLLTFTSPNECKTFESINISYNEEPSIAVTTNSPICDGQLILNATTGLDSPPVSSWEWTGPCDFTGSGDQIILNDFTADCAGEFLITATTASGCTTTESVMVEALSLPLPSLTSNCETSLCLGESCTLIGTEYIQGSVSYSWESDEGLELPLSTNNHILDVQAMVAGTFEVRYRVEVDGCQTEWVTLTIQVDGNPDAVDDFYEVPFETMLADIEVINNDQVANDFEIELVLPPAHGAISINADGTFDYEPAAGFIGEDQFTYRLCQECGDGSCDDATVRLNIAYDGECLIPTLITPNGDDLNDRLQILCLDDGDFPDNQLTIFNQWGDEVFYAAPYMNDWEGTLDGEAGKDLPDGTYFFNFKQSASSEAVKGFITIFR